MVLTVCFELSPVTGSFATVARGLTLRLKPGWADITSANLTPASGRQDHTTSPYAGNVSRPRARRSLTDLSIRPAIPSRARRCRVHRLPCLRPSRSRNAPLCGVGWREFVEMICPTGEAKYFCKEGWTPLSTKPPDGQITTRPRRAISKNQPLRARGRLLDFFKRRHPHGAVRQDGLEPINLVAVGCRVAEKNSIAEYT